LAKHDADLYGVEGRSEDHPGLMGHVNGLIAWKRRGNRWFWWLVAGVPAGVGGLISIAWHWFGGPAK
jgi:hypothetical protein